VFYEKLYEYIQTDPWLNNEIARIREHYDNWTTNGKIDHDPIQGMEIHGWNLIHSTVINLQGEHKHTQVFDLIDTFVKENFELPEDILNDLLFVQRKFLINYEECNSYPINIELKNDIIGYVQGDLLDNKSVYEFDFPENKSMSLQQFCEQIFFARRRNFGKSWITKLNDTDYIENVVKRETKDGTVYDKYYSIKDDAIYDKASFIYQPKMDMTLKELDEWIMEEMDKLTNNQGVKLNRIIYWRFIERNASSIAKIPNILIIIVSFSFI
jgi:hypothetical protein